MTTVREMQQEAVRRLAARDVGRDLGPCPDARYEYQRKAAVGSATFDVPVCVCGCDMADHVIDAAALVTCPRCGGDGVIGWNPTSPRDPQYDESESCPLCREACVVTLAAAEQFLDEHPEGPQVDGWNARDYDPPAPPRSVTVPDDAWQGVPW